jgi:lipopolysaccharide export system protein LptA
MFRRARWLLLLAIVAILTGVGLTFISQSQILRRTAPKKSAPLAPNLSATAEHWEYTKTEGDRIAFKVRARNYSQVKEPSTFLLEDLELEIYSKDGKTTDLVKTDKATFDTDQGSLYADGDVQITMGLPQGNQIGGRIVAIRSSKMHFDNRTTRVSSDQQTTFQTDRGDGESVGADYDPNTRELHLHKNVKLDWRGNVSGESHPERVMHIESDDVIYKERSSQILLSPWARLTRGQMTIEGNDAIIFLAKGEIERVEAHNANGKDRQPDKELEYGAAHLKMQFGEKSEVTHIEGIEKARLVSKSATARTTVTGGRIDLDFDPEAKESSLQKAITSGNGRVETVPADLTGPSPPPNRVLTSDVIEMTMRTGGKEIDKVITHSAGQIEFLPNRAGDKKRKLTGEKFVVSYGADNKIQSFRASNVTTLTETPAKEVPAAKDKPADPADAKPKVLLTRTTSKEFLADFDPKTGQMSRMEQWPDFEYEEGARRAKAQKAVLDNDKDLITLDTAARMADDTGSTSADRIVLEQSTGDFAAIGNVSSIRLPDRKKDAGSDNGMLSPSEPMQARARRMFAGDHNRKIRYEGDAVLWQGANRLQGQRVVIDRSASTLDASGGVVSQFADQRSDDDSGPPAGKARAAAPAKPKPVVFTTIHAGEMTYSDQAKLAHYKNNVTLERPGLEVKSKDLRAWFREEKDEKGSESKLDHLFADGAVDILDRMPDRTRRGTGDHAEYYLDDEKMILSGGSPALNDSKRGVSRGNVLTWFSRQDRLIVDNTGSGPAVSRILRK